MFFYHRLDRINLVFDLLPNANSTTDQSSTTAQSTNGVVYIEFVGDCGSTKHRLRFDQMCWAKLLAYELEQTHFKFVQSVLMLNPSQRPSNRDCSLAKHRNLTTINGHLYPGVGRLKNHPFALAYSPICE